MSAVVDSSPAEHRSLTTWFDRKLAAGMTIFLVALLPRILDLGRFFAPDEQLIWDAANAFTLALAEGNLAGTVTIFYPGVPLMWIETLAAAVKYGWLALADPGTVTLPAILGPDTPLTLLAEKRLALGLVHVGLILLIWVWLETLFGRWIAFLAGLLIALDPFFLAESRVIRMEALNAEFITLSVLSLLLYLNRERRRYLLLSGVFAALAMLTKMSSAYLLAFVGVVLAVWLTGWPRPRPGGTVFKMLLSRYGLWAGVTMVIVGGLWPAFWVQPLATWQVLWRYVLRVGGEGAAGRGVFFWGQIYPDDPGFWFYPVALAFRVGPLVLPGLLLALLGLAQWRRRAKSPGDSRPHLLLNVGVLAAFVASYVLFLTLIAIKYDRYLLPTLPALNVIAVLGLHYVGQTLIGRVRGPRATLVATAGLPVLILLVYGAVILRVHPYYYTYYNPLLGGTRQAAQAIRVGFGEGFDLVGEYLTTLPGSEQLRVASARSRDLESYFPGQTIALANQDGRWVQADYVFLYISQLQRGKHDRHIIDYLARHSPEYVLTMADFQYGWLYPAPGAQFYGGGHKLEGRGTLFGFDLGATELAAGQSLSVTLYWRNEGQREDDRFFVRLMDLDGYTWAEAIAQPRPGFEAAGRQENAIVESEAILDLPIGMPPGDYFLKPGFKTVAGELIGYFELPAETQPISVTKAQVYPASTTYRPPRSSPLAINKDLILQGYDFEFEALPPEPRLWLTLYWQALTDVDHDYVILLRLLDNNRQEAAYWLGRPLRSGYATTAWKAGQIVQDPWLLALPPEAGPGTYDLEIAVFDANSQAEIGRRPLSQVTFD